MAVQIMLSSVGWTLLGYIVGGVISSFVFIFVALFGVGHLLPRIWVSLERRMWRWRLGDSKACQAVINLEGQDVLDLIRQKEIDDHQPRTLAVLMVLKSRPREYPRLRHELERRVHGMETSVFTAAVNSLNKGWRSGTPPEILKEYIKLIEASEDEDAIPKMERLRGLCSAAMVKYALGDLEGGYERGRRNWDAADGLGLEDKEQVKWMASYAFFNSRMFQGHFEETIIKMADHWHDYYVSRDPHFKKKLKDALARKITLNPVLIIPRHMILAAAFKDGPFKGRPLPLLESKLWPNKEAYEKRNRNLDEIDKEIEWVEAWYAEAQLICADDLISLNFSHAYVGFYFTLLLHEKRVENTERAIHLRGKISTAFSSIGHDSPIVSQYVKYGFQGVYHFATGENELALDCLRRASASSGISGNRFAECIFIFCHAVAAARLKQSQEEMYWEPEVEHYIKKGQGLANKVKGDFYQALSDAAYSAVVKLEGGKDSEARRFAKKSQSPNVGKRILQLFLKDD